MEFINREYEINFIKEAKKLSENKLFTLVIPGLRRIGKTRLVQEILTDKDIYLFVNQSKSSDALLSEYEGVLKSKGALTDLESLNNWDDFFKVIFGRYRGVIAFDEFQNFAAVEPSAFGIFQKYIDLNEQKKGLLLIFLGSTIGLIKKIFEDAKEPLYGRVKKKLFLKPLTFANTVKMCHKLDIAEIEEIIILYSIFGGFPKYYVSIEDENLNGAASEEILEKLFFTRDAVLEEEVSSI